MQCTATTMASAAAASGGEQAVELTPADVAYLVAAHPGITGAVPQVLHAQVRVPHTVLCWSHSFRAGGVWKPRTASACAAAAVVVPWLRSCAANW
eukprot:COSAG01_NODE_1190_length_11321_cov_15.842809_2_plen_95_part_00